MSAANPVNMPNMSVNQGQQYIGKMQDAYYDQARSRLDPQWQQSSADLENKLANQGLSPGSEAYNRAKQQQQFGQNDAYAQARNQAILNSGSEAQRLQGMDIAAGQFGNQATQQNYQNQLSSQAAQNQAAATRAGLGIQSAQVGGQIQNNMTQQELAQAQLNNQAIQQQQALGQGYAGLGNQANIASAQNQLGYAGLNQQGNIAANQAANQYGMNQSNQANQYNMAGQQNQLGYAGLGNQWNLGNLQSRTAQNTANIGANAQMSSAATGAAPGMLNAQTNLANQQFNQSRQMAFDPILMQNMMMEGMIPQGPQFNQYGQAAYPGQQNSSQYAQQQIAGNNQAAAGMGNAAGSLGGYFMNQQQPGLGYGSIDPTQAGLNLPY
jgi:hypothetical protein